MTFNASIDLGQLVTIISVIVGGTIVFTTMRSDLRGLLSRVTSLEETVKKLTDILVTLGRQETRLDSHEKRLDQLEQR